MAIRLETRRAAAPAAAAAPATAAAPAAAVGIFRALKECIQIVVQHGEICLKLPYVGDVCVDIPDFIPDGTLVEACVELSFPACAKLTVKALGQTVVNQEFGIC